MSCRDLWRFDVTQPSSQTHFNVNTADVVDNYGQLLKDSLGGV